jgi:HlyD family secretion protein
VGFVSFFEGKNRLVGIVVAAGLGVLVLAAFVSLRAAKVPVRAEKAVRETISNTISTNGKIEPVQNFEAHAPVATTVRKIFVHEGDWVKKGQLLLQLEDADIRAQAARAVTQLRSAQADLTAVHTGGTHEEVLTNQAEQVKALTEREAAQRNLTAMQNLQQRGAASPAEVEEAGNRLKRAEAQVNLLEQKEKGRYSRPEVSRAQAQAAEGSATYAAAAALLRDANVRAERDGMVYSLPVREGQYVTAGDLLVQVADLATVQLRAFVDEPEIGRLAKGQKVTVTWDALPGRSWEGTLTRVPTTVSLRGTRTVGELTCEVANPDMKLLPNVNVAVLVITARHENALTIPREAVRDEAGKRYVFEIVDGELKRREVETSVSNLTRIEIARGLKDQAQVALGSETVETLREGMPVRVVR